MRSSSKTSGHGIAPDVLIARDVQWQVGGISILDGVSVRSPRGACTGIVGPNGCGKSTFIRACLGLLSGVQGSIELDGLDVASASPKAIAHTAALLAQHSASVVEMRVRDIVALGRIPHQPGWARPASRDEYVDRAMEIAGAAHLRSRYWSTLSGGERQRVQLARALAQEPRVLFVDEPTNHLDPGAAWQLMEAIRAQGVSVIGAFHDLNLAARFCDHIVVIVGGRVRAAGNPGEILTPELLREVYGITAVVHAHPDGGPFIMQTGVT